VIKVYGLGKSVTAVGGFVLVGSSPAAGYHVRLSSAALPACGTGSPTADVEVDPDGFYFAGPLPDNVKWYMQVCNGATQVATRKLANPVKSKDFDEENFTL
jgi:hypothetical protein